jgi:hypothetical protein
VKKDRINQLGYNIKTRRSEDDVNDDVVVKR